MTVQNQTFDVKVRLQPAVRLINRALKKIAPVTEPAAMRGRLPRITQVLALALQFQEMLDRGDIRVHADLARLGAAVGDLGLSSPPAGPETEAVTRSAPAEPSSGAAVARPARGTPAERRQAAGALLATWTAVARDLAVVAAGSRSAVRDAALLEDLEAVSARLPPGSVVAFLGRLVRAAELLEGNANPELLVDVLVLAWPHASAPLAGR